MCIRDSNRKPGSHEVDLKMGSSASQVWRMWEMFTSASSPTEDICPMLCYVTNKYDCDRIEIDFSSRPKLVTPLSCGWMHFPFSVQAVLRKRFVLPDVYFMARRRPCICARLSLLWMKLNKLNYWGSICQLVVLHTVRRAYKNYLSVAAHLVCCEAK